jgi:hypothetical protein
MEKEKEINPKSFSLKNQKNLEKDFILFGSVPELGKTGLNINIPKQQEEQQVQKQEQLSKLEKEKISISGLSGIKIPEKIKEKTPFLISEFKMTELEKDNDLRNIFNYYKNLGLFKKDTALNVWYPIINFVKQKRIPSWEDVAIWQLDVFDRIKNIETKSREIANLLYQGGYLKRNKTPYTPEDIMSIVYALNFKKILRFSADTIYGVNLPSIDISSIKDNDRLRILKWWVDKVYNGYKLLNEPIPIELKNLYSSLSKGEISGIIMEEITGLREEIENFPQSEFLNKISQ